VNWGISMKRRETSRKRYYNAAYETQPVLALRSSEEEPLQGLIRCYEQLGLPAQARSYAEELKHRQNEQTDN
jgi:hypothetical protein